jgi:hypothetical protein
MMPFKPSFTTAHLAGNTVQVTGVSEDPSDILDIRVVLTQERQAAGGSPQVASASVAQLGESWQADIPSDGFERGHAVAFGVETRRTNVTTITWAEPLDIQ